MSVQYIQAQEAIAGVKIIQAALLAKAAFEVRGCSCCSPAKSLTMGDIRSPEKYLSNGLRGVPPLSHHHLTECGGREQSLLQ